MVQTLPNTIERYRSSKFESPFDQPIDWDVLEENNPEIFIHDNDGPDPGYVFNMYYASGNVDTNDGDASFVFFPNEKRIICYVNGIMADVPIAFEHIKGQIEKYACISIPYPAWRLVRTTVEYATIYTDWKRMREERATMPEAAIQPPELNRVYILMTAHQNTMIFVYHNKVSIHREGGVLEDCDEIFHRFYPIIEQYASPPPPSE